MSKDRLPVAAGPPNAGDVVEGPVGAAGLRQPSPSGPAGVDLEALASIDVKPDREAPARRPIGPDAASRRGHA